MRRKEEYYILIGLFVAVLSCLATWLALPQVQSRLDPWLVNPLFWPFVGVVGLLVLVLIVVLPFTDLGALRNRLYTLLPGRSFESIYLKVLVERLGNTPALLVIGGRDDTRRELNLLQAFSQLTLKPDTDAPEDRGAALPELVAFREAMGRVQRR